MNAWREELRALLQEISCRRPPTLRRSLKDGWLYATDLPQCAEPVAATAFQQRAMEQGWCSENSEGWIQLTREITLPPQGGFDGPFGEEAACCRSLTVRHRDSKAAKSDAVERWLTQLTKAGEEGPEAYEKACRQIHQIWAAGLRKGKGIPVMDPRWFGAAEQEADPDQ